jgi:hypothetical protein
MQAITKKLLANNDITENMPLARDLILEVEIMTVVISTLKT